MAKRDTSSYRQRARKQPGGRASSGVPPRARAQAREASQEAQSAQAELLQNVHAAGQTIANAVFTRVAANGTVCIYTSAGTDLVVDVSGHT